IHVRGELDNCARPWHNNRHCRRPIELGRSTHARHRDVLSVPTPASASSTGSADFRAELERRTDDRHLRGDLAGDSQYHHWSSAGRPPSDRGGPHLAAWKVRAIAQAYRAGSPAYDPGRRTTGFDASAGGGRDCRDGRYSSGYRPRSCALRGSAAAGRPLRLGGVDGGVGHGHHPRVETARTWRSRLAVEWQPAVRFAVILQSRPARLPAALILPALLLGAWQIAATQQWLDGLYFPPPLKIWDALWRLSTDHTLVKEGATTVARAIKGWVIGGAIGAAVGLALSRSQSVERAVAPTLEFMRSFPAPVIVPVALLFLGVGER